MIEGDLFRGVIYCFNYSVVIYLRKKGLEMGEFFGNKDEGLNR